MKHPLAKRHIAWSDLSPSQRLATVLAATLQIALLVAALVDIAQRPAKAIRGSKGMWAAIAFINFVGPLAYFLWGRQPDSDAP